MVREMQSKVLSQLLTSWSKNIFLAVFAHFQDGPQQSVPLGIYASVGCLSTVCLCDLCIQNTTAMMVCLYVIFLSIMKGEGAKRIQASESQASGGVFDFRQTFLS